ncbi:hypothetical protein KY285_033390 [Solanum tuberosum]|nr:hypothetical protein KY285_033390 [Solanum tuberosum]
MSRAPQMTNDQYGHIMNILDKDPPQTGMMANMAVNSNHNRKDLSSGKLKGIGREHDGLYLLVPQATPRTGSTTKDKTKVNVNQH